MADRIALSLKDVKKGFGQGGTRIEVLRSISLDAFYGEILLLVGPSGCGKTTLLSVLSGLLDCDAGAISVFGERIDRLNAAQKTAFRKKNLGFVFQQFNLIPTLNAAQNAAVPLLIGNMALKPALSQAAELLAKVGMAHRVNAMPAELSGGEQQRVAIARSLISNPRLLICDEPTAALDGETGASVMEILRSTSLSNNRCVIVVTHDSRVFPFGDRIARMLDGCIESIESREEALAAVH